METIIGLLFILLPVIFNLIGKRLEQSGKTDKAGKFREIAKTLGADDDDTVAKWLAGEEEAGPEPVREPVAAPVVPSVPSAPTSEPARPTTEVVSRTTTRPKNVAAKPSVIPRKKVLVEDEKKKGEKIDPKKLVIYSEIMKPKYTE